MEQDLIYDIGLHNGDDTAYYLGEGYRVVAVDANPALIVRARKRFEHEIDQARLTLLNVAIGPQESSSTFWISEVVSEWSSLDNQVAGQLGFPHHAITVSSRGLRSIIGEYGVPFYLKIDIEKADRHCLADLTPATAPPYVSVEYSDLDDLLALRGLGYNAFKVIHQSPRHGHAQFRAAGSAAPTNRTASGPSGPFGEASAGIWVGFEETAYDLLSFVLGHSEFGDPPDWFIWFDVHATRLSTST